MANDVVNFNSHAHVERDVYFPFLKIMGVNFNSHAHVERDTDFAALNICKNYFNSHAHVERDYLLFYELKD